MGRASAIDDHDLLDRLTEVFRCHGYAGASLTVLSQAAGLQRASLYHRFPEGKPAMAAAVLNHAERMFTAILEPLTTAQHPADGVAEMAQRIGAFYRDGRRGCLLDTMTLDGAPDDIRVRATAVARRWMHGMAAAAMRSGASQDEAERRAHAALVNIEGALVVARVLDDPTEFDNTLAWLPQLLTATPSSAAPNRGDDR
ncbi:TetR/AcrR family transcriptional regulator [Kribbella sp. CA-293567]|uniref:TetR/AcrR family transcriptional regulator n=1 Tax=Kribbella sp. CA-293567 TaxID=3002436 RepID=UPI0022DE328A|nr:TetR/AcrR family transcriptional regulator [Kribbella sp. CA-293567]WBQ04398.1 TetR/AcrR family transcriptional regulator [Kribbella sp. CA-293567]